jgi:hypothetical protein
VVEIELVELNQQTSLGVTIFTGISHYMGLRRGYNPPKKMLGKSAVMAIY